MFTTTTNLKILKCSRCKQAFYCSVACQKSAWPDHKKVCHKPSYILVSEYNTLSDEKKKKYENDPTRFFFTSIPSEAPTLTKEQEEDAKKLISSIDQGISTADCKKIGQEIFDKYKENGGTQAGKQAVQDIRDWVTFNCKNREIGNQLAENIERDWNGIGDENWRWLA